MTEFDWLNETRPDRLLVPIWRHSKRWLKSPFVLPKRRCCRLMRLVIRDI